eukprot:Rmarinus@m.23912
MFANFWWVVCVWLLGATVAFSLEVDFQSLETTKVVVYQNYFAQVQRAYHYQPDDELLIRVKNVTQSCDFNSLEVHLDDQSENLGWYISDIRAVRESTRCTVPDCDSLEADIIRLESDVMLYETMMDVEDKRAFSLKGAIVNCTLVPSPLCRTAEDELKESFARRAQAAVQKQEASSKLQKLRQQRRNLMVNDVEIRVQPGEQVGEQPPMVQVLISYMVSGASWRPFYELHVDTSGEGSLSATESKDSSDPESGEATGMLYYYAVLTQRTGEDWDNVPLQFSTTQQTHNLEVPDVPKIHFGERVHYPEMSHRRAGGAVHKMAAPMASMNMDADMLMVETSGAMPVQEEFAGGVDSGSVNGVGGLGDVQQGHVSGVFQLRHRATIPHGTTDGKMLIRRFEVPATLERTCIPQSSSEVYVTATIQNNNDLPILAGELKTFADRSFVASTFMPSLPSGAEHRVPIGIDQFVTAVTELRDVQRETGVFSTMKHIVYARNTTIINDRPRTNTISVRASYPYASNEKIEIKLLHPAKDAANVHISGHDVVWELVLDPHESRSVTMEYQVSWPEDFDLQVPHQL